MSVNDITITIKAQVVNVQQALGQVTQGLQQTTAAAKNIHGPFAVVHKDLSATANLSRTAGAGVTTFGNQAQQSQSKLQRFGEAFKGNRGIVFGIAGLTSALAEAVGMMGMYGDSALRLSEAQSKLNQLMDKGVTSGKAYQDAQNEVTKQQRFFNMVQRNTILSQMDMIFFTTMAVSGFIKLGSGTSKVGGALSKLVSVFKVANTGFMEGTGALANFNAATVKGSQGAGLLGRSIGVLGISIKGALIGTGIGAAIVGIGLLVQKFMEWQEAVKKTEEANKRATEVIKNDVEAMSAITSASATEALDSLEGLSEGGAESLEILAEAIRNTSVQMEVSTTRSKMINAERLRDEAMTSAGIIKVKMHEAQAEIKLRALRERGNLQKMLKEDPYLKQLTEDFNTATNAALTFDKQAKDLKASLDGVGQGAIDLGDTTKMINDNLNVLNAEASTATDTFTKMSSEWIAAGNQGKTANQVMAAVSLTLKDLVANNELNAVSAALQEKQWEKLLGVYDEGSVKIKETTMDMSLMEAAIISLNTELLVTSDNINKAYSDQAASKFWDAFSAGSAEANALMKQAETQVAQFFIKWKSSIEAGMDPQQKFNELLANSPLLLQPALLAAYAKAQQQSKDSIKDTNKALDEQIEKDNEARRALSESIIELQKRDLVFRGTRQENELMVETYDNTIGSILEQADAIKMEQQMWATLTPRQKEAIENANNYRLAQAAVIPILQQGAEGQQAYTEAVIAGKQQFSDFMQNLLAGNVASNTYRASLSGQVQAYKDLIDPATMTNAELESFIGFLNMSDDALVQYERQMEAAVDQNIAFFSSLIGAENMKDFNKQWKDLDLGAVPKNLRDDFKDMFEGFREGSEKTKEFATSWTMASVAVAEGGEEISKADIHKTVGKALDVFDKGSSKMPGFGKMLQDNVLKNFQNLNKDELYKKLEQFPITSALISQVTADGIVTFDEYNQVLQEQAKEQAKASGEANAAIDPNDKLARQINQISINQSIYARTLVQTTLDVQALTKATNELYAAQTDLSLLQDEMNPFGFNGEDSYWVPWSFRGFQDKTNEITKDKKGLPDDSSYKDSRQWGDMFRNVSLGGIIQGNGKGQSDPKTEAKKMWDPMAMAAGEASKQIQTVFSAMFTAVNGIFDGIGKHWSMHMNKMGTNANSGSSQIINAMNNMAAAVQSLFNTLGSNWSMHMNKMGANAESGAEQIIDAMNNMAAALLSLFNTLAKNWSKTMNSMGANARSGANQVNSALAKIKTKIVTVHEIHTVRIGQAEGGVWPSGMIKAASGLVTQTGPTNIGPFQYGEAGKETMAFLPHYGNKAQAIMDQLDTMFGRKKSVNIIQQGGGDRDIIVPITVNINGEQYSFTQRYRQRQGHDLATQVF